MLSEFVPVFLMMLVASGLSITLLLAVAAVFALVASLVPMGRGLGAVFLAALALYLVAAFRQERAAANGNIKAMHNLAVLAAGSAVGRPDYIKAARWFTVAAKHGLGDSQFNLAILYQHGLGVEQDDGQAYQWFSLAALSGDAEAGKRKSEVASLIGKAQAAEIARRVAAWNRRSVDKVANDPHAAGQEWQRSG